MSTNRNRSEGWSHAKKSGAENENLSKRFVEDNPKLFSSPFGKTQIVNVCANGLNEKNVDSILGGSTKSKADLCITYNDDSKIKLSIKKSSRGQVYLIKSSRFISGFKAQFGIEIPSDVVKSISLFFGEDDNAIKDYEKCELSAYERKRNRLTAESMIRYAPDCYTILLDWFRQNIENITLFCFAYGLAKNEDDRAQYVWYNNELGENNDSIIFDINKLAKESVKYKKNINYGTRNGGTTIILPFGFVQWHQNSMQFHHSLDDLKSNMKTSIITDFVKTTI